MHSFVQIPHRIPASSHPPGPSPATPIGFLPACALPRSVAPAGSSGCPRSEAEQLLQSSQMEAGSCCSCSSAPVWDGCEGQSLTAVLRVRQREWEDADCAAQEVVVTLTVSPALPILTPHSGGPAISNLWMSTVVPGPHRSEPVEVMLRNRIGES